MTKKKKKKKLRKWVKAVLALAVIFSACKIAFDVYAESTVYQSIQDEDQPNIIVHWNSTNGYFYTDNNQVLKNANLLVSVDGNSYFQMKTDDYGKPLTGWQKTETGQYYYDENGFLITDSSVINGRWYELDENGRMLDQEWKNDLWYMDGKAIGTEHDTLLFIKGETGFYFLSAGDGGQPVKNGERTLNDGRKIKYDENGHIVTDESKDENGYYYPIVEAFETADVTKDIPVTIYERSHSSSDTFTLINHRGYHESAPENTLLAFEESQKQGYEYVETDIQFTKDGVPVLLHDGTINAAARNADGSALKETVSIKDLTYAEVLQYDFGISRGKNYAGTTITSFEEFIAWCSANQIKPYIELKDQTIHTDDEVSQIIDIIEQYDMLDKVSIISFSDALLSFAHTHAPKTRIGYLVGSNNDVEKSVSLLNTMKDDGASVFIDAEYSSQNQFLSTCRNDEIPLELWTVDSLSTLNQIDSYVTGVTTDSIIPS